MIRFWGGAAVLLAILGKPLVAEELKPRWEFGVSYVAGTATEYVFQPSAERYYNNPVSRLTWAIPPSLAATFTVEMPWLPWTASNFRLQVAQPVVTGTLIDEDWNAGSYIYARSEHPTQMTANLSAQLEQTFHLRVFDVLIGGLYRWMSWEAWDGSGAYTTSSGTENVSFTGPIIAYHQQWLIPYLGLSTTFRLAGLGWTPTVRFGPTAICWDRDDHNYAQNIINASTGKPSPPLTFLDTVWGGYYFQSSLDVSLSEGNMDWGLRISGQMTRGAMGDTTTTYPYQGSTPPSYENSSWAAGAQFEDLSLTVFVRN